MSTDVERDAESHDGLGLSAGCVRGERRDCGFESRWGSVSKLWGSGDPRLSADVPVLLMGRVDANKEHNKKRQTRQPSSNLLQDPGVLLKDPGAFL